MLLNLCKLEDDIWVIVRGFVDYMVIFGIECDFVKDVVFFYLLYVVMKILGVFEFDELFMLKFI